MRLTRVVVITSPAMTMPKQGPRKDRDQDPSDRVSTGSQQGSAGILAQVGDTASHTTNQQTDESNLRMSHGHKRQVGAPPTVPDSTRSPNHQPMSSTTAITRTKQREYGKYEEVAAPRTRQAAGKRETALQSRFEQSSSSNS